ncbi:MAG: gliding motility-associated C-terminal domain-containing protein [Nitrospinaceae bacterium]|nr:gliding motility-associated C-terminal domain-containing protein [Nitrospinaceae bacterium]
MKNYFSIIKLTFFVGLLLLGDTSIFAQCASPYPRCDIGYGMGSCTMSNPDCDPGEVVSYDWDLRASPDTLDSLYGVTRYGLTCGNTGTQCIRFNVKLHPATEELSFDMSQKSGATFYSVDCGPLIPIGDTICIAGIDSFCLTLCKPGCNAFDYWISASRKTAFGPDITVSEGCSDTLWAVGLDPASVTWTSIWPGPVGTHDGLLSCTSCDSAIITGPTPIVEDSIAYQVTGLAIGCSAGPITSTIWVKFVPGMNAFISPPFPAICDGDLGVELTASGTGGAKPYTFVWTGPDVTPVSTTDSTSKIIAGAIGIYSVEMFDTTDCDPAVDTVEVVLFAAAISADAGPDDTVCADAPAVNLEGIILVADSARWTSLTGAGVFAPTRDRDTTIYTPDAAEIFAGTATLMLESRGNRGCAADTDTIVIVITAVPFTSADVDDVICEGSTYTLNGSFGGGATTITWTTDGDGTFDDDTLRAATYTPGGGDISTGSVNLAITTDDPPGPCIIDSDTMILTIDPIATVGSGGPATICEGSSYRLSGSFGGGASSITWAGGDGLFDDNTLPAATYSPGPLDIGAGSVILTITSDDPAGPCPFVSATMTLTINAAPTVGAGGDATICAGTTHTLSGTMGGSTSSITWSSSGTGSFDDVNLLGATYTPSDADTAAPGIITLTITSNDPDGAPGPCTAVAASMTLTINPEAVVSAGGNATICAGTTHLLSGTKAGATASHTWTTSGTGTFDDDAILGATYTPSDADTAAPGIITLTLTSNDPDAGGPCTAVSNAMILTINPEALVGSGGDATICAGSTHTLAGTKSGSTATTTWTSSGTGTFDDDAILGATYTPSDADTAAPGVITLTITSNDPDGGGPCTVVSNTMILTINPEAIISAGANATICAGTAHVLAGTKGGATATHTWTTSGTGAFDDDAILGATYTPSDADTAAPGIIILTLTSNDPDAGGPCTAVSSAMTLTINPEATVGAGADAAICAYDTHTLLGTMGGSASLITWTTSGTGSFDDVNLLSATYTPSAGDTALPNVTLTITTNDPDAIGPCAAASDFMVLSFTPADRPSFSYSSATYCVTGADPTPVIAGTPGGIFSGAGVVFLGGLGQIDLDATGLGVYAVEYLTPGPSGCPDSLTVAVTITLAPDATFSYATPFCQGDPNPFPSFPVGASAGKFSAVPVGMVFANDNTGEIDLTASTPGLYTVRNLIVASGGCSADSAFFVVTIDVAPTVGADVDDTICEGSTYVLSGVMGGSTSSITWTTSGDGGFNLATLLGAEYTPGATDITTTSVTLKITSDDPAGPCVAIADSMVLTINLTATADAGSDTAICEGSLYTLAGVMGGTASSITWTTPGDGSFDNPALPGATYTPGSGDIGAGFITLTITTNDPDGAEPCVPAFDDVIVTINPIATVSAGPNDTICAGSTSLLAGVFGGGASSITWTTPGDGGFNDPNLPGAIYTPGVADIAAGSVVLTITTDDPDGIGPCTAVSNTMTLTINAVATSNAGSDTTICSDAAYTLAGSFGGSATSITWSTPGDGLFDNNTLPGATYTPGVGDIAAGFITLTITTNDPDGPGGPCIASFDDMVLTIDLAATASASANDTICDGSTYFLLGAFGGSASSITWTTTGDGGFDDANLPGAEYTPGPLDRGSGIVSLTITTDDPVGPCPFVFDVMVLNIDPIATVDAGKDTTICSGSAYSLSGSRGGGASTSEWTTTGDGTFSDSSLPLAIYTPGPADIAAGIVTLGLTTDDPSGPCLAVSDSLDLTINATATASAGADDTICAGITYTLAGAIGGSAGSLTWSTSGTGSFSSNIIPAPVYTPSAADTGAGSVVLTITTNDPDGAGPCAAAVDSMVLTIENGITVDAGPDDFICANNPFVSLLGSVTGATTTGGWITLGTGTFTPDTFTMTPIYNASVVDTILGSVTIVLQSTNNGGCIPRTDTMIVTIGPGIYVNAGPNDTVCANKDTILLAGSVSGASITGKWTTSGTGSFTPHDSDFAAQYIPSDADTAAGSVTITLTSTNNGLCLPVQDSMLIEITPGPQVGAGLDAFACKNNPNIILSGTVTGATSTGDWLTLGDGSFVPASSNLGATYVPGVGDTTFGSATLVLSSTFNGDCYAVRDTVILSYTDAPIVNAGPDDSLCASDSVFLTGTVIGGAGTGKWTTTGTGTFSPNDSDLLAAYIFSVADTSLASIELILSSTNAVGCLVERDTMAVDIVPAPQVNAGSDQSVCANNDTVILSGLVFGATTTGKWTTTGPGSFSPHDSELNATYLPGYLPTVLSLDTLILTSTNNGLCAATSDTMLIDRTPAPSVDAGNDTIVCSGDNLALTGIVIGGASSGKWTTTGTGTFAPNDSDLLATYTPSAADTVAGFIQISLESTNNGGCVAVFDTLNVTFTLKPTVLAGTNITVCANNDSVFLSGTVAGSSTTGQWVSNGSGSFSPNDSDLGAVYIPSDADTTSGSVRIILFATNSCPISDTLFVTITPAPQVNAGSDFSICFGDTSLTLVGTVIGGSSTGKWTTTGDGSFSPNDSDLNPTYFLGIGDTLSTITMILTSTTNGNCIAVVDSIIVTRSTIAIVNAGIDFTFCSNNATIPLTGTVSGGGTAGIWTSSGTGTFADSVDLTTTYTPSPADTAAGSVTITLTSTDACLNVADSAFFTLTPAPQVNAGPNVTSCANNPDAVLSGAVFAGATTGEWLTLGDGTFSPTKTNLGATYTPGGGDIAAGSATLVLTSTFNGTCFPETDTMTVIIGPAPLVDAGANQVVCNGDDVFLNGSVTAGSTTGFWTSTGTGTFADASLLNAVYTPSAADTVFGSVFLILSSTFNGTCVAVSDIMTVTLTTKPKVVAGNDTSVCANNASIALSGSVTGSTTSGRWSTSGSGTFSPNDSDLSATYIPSNSDTIAGSVTIHLVSTNACQIWDSLTITITPAPEVDGGPDQIHCSDTLSVDLVGSVSSGATTGIWTTSGSGVFTNDTLLSTTYLASSADTLLGIVSIALTSTNNGKCFAVVDSMTISFVPPPVVTVSGDQVLCANQNVPLSGTVSGGSTTGFWSTVGTGSFVVDSSDLNGSYIFSAADTALPTLTIVLESFSSPGCPAKKDSFLVTILPAPQVFAGNDTTVCMNNDTIFLNGTVQIASTTGKWTSNGTGTFLPNDSDLTGIYVPSQADNDSGSVVLTLTSTNNGNGCLAVTDNFTVTFSPSSPVVSAGFDTYRCNGSGFNLIGSVTGGATTGLWTTTGAGTFMASDSILAPSYFPGATDTSTAFIVVLTSTNNGTCLAESDTINVIYTAPPTVSAGPDDTVCTNNDSVFLTGVVSGTSTTGYWSSTGTGNFSPDSTALAGTYSPSSADAAAGTISLFLQSTNACLVTDTLVLEIIPAPFVTTGGPYILCVGDTAASLTGVISGITTTGIWTTPGTGTFSPNDSDLNGTYFLGLGEQAIGDSTMLVLTSTNNGQCLAEFDTSYIVITSIPTVSAGPDDIACANVNYQLNGSVVGGAGTGMWSTLGSGSFTPDSTALTGNYIFSAADTTIKLVTLVLTTTDACVTLTDTMDLTVTPAPMVAATIKQAICSNMDSVELFSNIIVASGGTWTTNGAGTFFPDSTAALGSDSVMYVLGQQEIDSGNIIITLTSTGNGNCNPESGVLDILIIAAPIVLAGPNQSVCFDNFNVLLNGSVVSAANTGVWSSSGSGFFAPDDSTVNAVYVPSLLDTTAGAVTLTLTSTNNGTCNVVADSLIVTWSERPVVQVAGDTSVCVGTASIPISGTVTGSPGTGIWTSNGTGTFSPSNTVISPAYNPSSADDSLGIVVLTLTATNGCAPSLDSLTIYINPNPVAIFNATTFCDSLDVPIVDQSLVNSGAIAGWNWNFGDGFTDSVQFPSHTYINTGNFNIQLIVTSDSGCTSTANQAISLNSLSSSFSVVPGCVGQIVPFTDSSIVFNDSIVSWTWDFGDFTTSSSQNAQHTYLTDGQYVVSLTVQTQAGCILSSSQTITINPKPIAGFTVSNLKPVQFDIVSFFDQSTGASIWAWDFGNGETSQLQNPSHEYEDYGTFIVTQYVQTDSGCSDTLTMSIEVIGEFAADLPTAFSPNGNGENDIFYARGGPFTEMLLKVYNEWGELIFSSTEPGIGGGWDGTYKDIPQPVGVYAYIIVAVLDSGEEFNRNGDITLVR